MITDNDTKSVLFFKQNGKFIKKVKSPSGTFSQIIFDRFNDKIQIAYTDWESGLIKQRKTYTSSGEEQYDVKNSKDEWISGDIILEPGYTIKFNDSHINTLSNLQDTIIYLIHVYKGKSLYNKFLPVNPSKSPGFCYFAGNLSKKPDSYYVQDNSVLISMPIDKSVYKIDKDKAVKVFDVGFPKGIEFPKDMLKINDTRILDSLKKVPLSPNLIFNLANIFFDKNKLVFKGQSPMYVSNMNTGNPNYIFNFIYDQISNHVVALEKLNPDASSYYLPAFNPRDNLMVNGIRFYKESYYSHISSLDLFFARDATGDKNPKYPPVLRNYFSSQNRKSNPVIVRMKLKS